MTLLSGTKGWLGRHRIGVGMILALLTGANSSAMDTTVDFAVSTNPRADGLGIIVTPVNGRAREVARLRVEGFDSYLWTGYACLTGSGRYIAATFSPAEATNDAQLRHRGAFLAIVDLHNEQVRFSNKRVALTYHNPGCGRNDEIAAVRYLGQQGQVTDVMRFDPATARIVESVRVTGHYTAPTPSHSTVFLSGGKKIVSIERGRLRTIRSLPGQAVDLNANEYGGVDFMSMRGTRLTALRTLGAGLQNRQLVRIASGRVGQMRWKRGRGGVNSVAANANTVMQHDSVPVLQVRDIEASLSLDGGSMVSVPPLNPRARTRPSSDGSAMSSQTVLEQSLASSQTKSRTVNRSRIIKTLLQRPNTTLSTCAIGRNRTDTQVMQPSHEQVEWAVHRAVRGQLKITRPANWNANGLDGYALQDSTNTAPRYRFAYQPLTHGGNIPAQVLLGLLSQESNLWQAARGALPGVAANPLIGDYYGAVYVRSGPERGRLIGMDYDDADCGYGIGQITDHMRKGDRYYSLPQKKIIATDYLANIVVSQRILAQKWNELIDKGLIDSNTDPSKIENWYLALWAYNTGYRENSTFQGLGWTNNPANSDYKFDRQYFLRDSYNDARRPGDWSYPERVLGFAERGFYIYGDRAFLPAGRLDLPVIDNPADPDAPQLVDRFLFCDNSNNCDSTHAYPGPVPRPGDASFCKLHGGPTSRQCWWHKPLPFEFRRGESGGTVENPGGHVPRSGEPPTPRPYPASCGADDSTLPFPTLDGVDSPFRNAVIVDNVPADAPNLAGCGRVQRDGRFRFEYGNNDDYPHLARVDLHQLGIGYGGHMWYTHTNWEDRPTHQISGRWIPPQSVTGWQRILVHIPSVGADTYQARYLIHDRRRNSTRPAPYQRVVNQRWNRNQWVDLGVFWLDAGASVELKNDTFTDHHNGRNVDIAWDAVAFVPAEEPALSHVALGDSYASGEGAPDSHYFPPTDSPANTSNQANRCHRSRSASPVLAFQDLAGRISDGSSSFATIACTGAAVDKITGSDASDVVYGEVPQLEQGWIDRNTTHVTVTAGANDAGLFKYMTDCSRVNCASREMVARQNAAFRPLRDRYVDLLEKIHAQGPNAKIAMIGYPLAVPEPDDFSTARCPGYTAVEIEQIRIAGNRLNTIMRDAVRSFNGQLNRTVANYVDLRPVYAGREACRRSGVSWIHDLELNDQGLPENRSFRPKPIGHRNAVETVVQAMTGDNEPGNRFQEFYPLQTWTLSAEVTARVKRLIDVRGDVLIQLMQMDDVNSTSSDPVYDVKFQARAGVGGTINLGWVGIPLGGSLSAFVGEAASLTARFTAAEMAWLAEQGIPFIPENEGLFDNVDTSGVNPLAVGELVSISVFDDLRGAIDGVDFPFIPSNDVFNRLTGFRFPDSFNVDGELRIEYEIRKKNGGLGWELVSSQMASGAYEVVRDGASTGGFIGSVLDVISAIDLDNLTFSGARTTLTEQLIFATHDQSFTKNRIVERQSFEGDASEGGVDIPIIDEITDGLAYTILTSSTGNTRTETYETQRSIDDRIIGEVRYTSLGYFRESEASLILASSVIKASFEGHSARQAPGREFPLSCRADWDPCQKRQMCAKVNHLNTQVPIITRAVTDEMKTEKEAAQKRFRREFPADEAVRTAPWANRCGKTNGKALDADHKLEVMFGGATEGPLWWLDASVNQSLGAQGNNRLEIGDAVSRFTPAQDCGC